MTLREGRVYTVEENVGIVDPEPVGTMIRLRWVFFKFL